MLLELKIIKNTAKKRKRQTNTEKVYINKYIYIHTQRKHFINNKKKFKILQKQTHFQNDLTQNLSKLHKTIKFKNK